MMNSNTSLWFYSSEQRYYSGAYFITMLSLGCLFLISGKFYFSFGAIDSILMIYFLFFTATAYPANVTDFSKLFGRFLYDFLPNFISDYLDTSKVTSNPPKVFKLNGFGGFYLDNTSISCEIIGLFLGLYCLVKLLSYIPIFSFQIWIRRSILQKLEYDSFIYIFWIFSHQFAIFSLIQLQNGLSFSSTAEIVSSTILITTGPVIGLAPLMILYKICKWRVLFENPESHQYNRIKTLSLLRGLKIKLQKRVQELVLHEQKRRSKLFYVDSFDAFSASTGDDLLKEMKNRYSLNQQKHFSELCKYTNVILLIRRMAFVLAIVFLQDQIYAQMGLISGFNVALFLFFTIKKPYISRLDNLMNSLIELLFIVIQALLCLFDYFTDSSLLIKFGWIYIILVLIILGLHFLSFLSKSYSLLKSFFQNKPQKVKQNKIVPSIKNDTPTEKVGPRFGDHIFIGSLKHNILDTTSNSTPTAQQNNSKLNVLSLTPTPINKQPPIIDLHNEQTQIEKSLPTEQTALQTDSQFFINPKVSEKVPQLPRKFANTSFSTELHFDYSENMKSRKQRLKKLFFKRNPFISQEDQDLVIKEKDSQSRTTVGRQGSSFLFQN